MHSIAPTSFVLPWLDGFAPSSEPQAPLDDLDTLAQPAPASHLIEVVPQLLVAPATCWPTLSADALDWSGDIGRFNANIAALKLRQLLIDERRSPSAAERLILQHYAGWGGLASLLDDRGTDPLAPARRDSLRALVSDAEFESITDSINNAHYTPLWVANLMWAAIQRFGFRGGHILEPSAGVGHFLGTAPASIVAASRFTAVEIDLVTADICRHLYGHASDVRCVGLEKAELEDERFDLAIGNIPFGRYSVPDTRGRAYSDWTIANYFWGRSLDLVRPGGLIAFITSTFTLESNNVRVREYLAGKAHLVGAIRLPSGAFHRSAGTEVSSDILFFRRYDGSTAPSRAAWVEQAPAPLGHAVKICNKHFADHPQYVLGRMSHDSSREARLLVTYQGADLTADAAQLIGTLPADCYTARPARRRAQARMTKIAAPESLKPGAFVVHNERVHRVEAGHLVDLHDSLPALTRQRIVGMVRVRDITRRLLAAQISTDDESALAVLRVELNGVYDAFVSRFGFISTRANALAMRRDPDYPLLLSLEIWDHETQTAQKAPLFSRRTVNRPQPAPQVASLGDALLVTLAELGEIDFGRIAQLVSLPVDAVQEQLLGERHVFVDPGSGEYVAADEYLSGDVRSKLRAASQAGAGYEANVEALQAVQPPDIEAAQIDVRLGASWLPTSVIDAFIDELLGLSKTGQSWLKASATQEPRSGAWHIDYPSYGLPATATVEFGTERANAFELIKASLNLQVATIYETLIVDGKEKQVVNAPETAAAREKQSAIEHRFREWIFEEKLRRDSLVRLYNDRFNSHRPRVFDGRMLRPVGFTDSVTLRKNQVDAIWRILRSGNTLVGHRVGAGKTMIYVVASMEMRRLGYITKPIHIVQGSTLTSYCAEFLRCYPSANVLMATKEDLAGDARREFVARVATGDWDAIVMTHSTFERIAVSAAQRKVFLATAIGEIDAALAAAEMKGNRMALRELKRQRKHWVAKLERATEDMRRKDDFLSFETLGVDCIILDEAARVKNLYRHSRMGNIAGLPMAASERAFDMLMKTRLVMAKHAKRQFGIVFGTATWISNSIAELHVFQRFLQPDTLRELGLESFDAWASTFGQIVVGLEIAPDGSGYRINKRFARFVNVPELLSVFREVADIQTREMLVLPTPQIAGGKAQVDVAPCSDELKAFMRKLVKRADCLRAGGVPPSKDNMLSITFDGRCASLDLRVVDPSLPDVPESKVNKCVQRVFELWQRTSDKRGVQAIFCDLSTPTSRGWNVYDDIRDKLVAKGIPRQEIAFIHEHDSDAARNRLFAECRSGIRRVILGSTEKLGTGVNVQTLLKAVHHIDAPWRPSDVEQRDGRADRPGNSWPEIEIWRYVTEASLDAWMWQALESKAKFIAQAMRGDVGVRSIEDAELAALTYAEVKALASGNPMVLRKAEVDTEVARLSLLKTQWRSSRWRFEDIKATRPSYIVKAIQRRDGVQADMAALAAQSSEEKVFVVNGKRYADSDEGAMQLLTRAAVDPQGVGGTWRGLRVYCIQDVQGVRFFAQGHARYDLEQLVRPSTLLDRLHRTSDSVALLLSDQEARIQSLQNELAAAEAGLAAPFEHEDKLASLVREQAQLNAALDLDRHAQGAEALDEEEVA